MSYRDALKMPKTSTQELSCSSLVFNDDTGYTTIYKDFTLFCHKTIKTLIILSNVIGNMLGYIFFVPMADIYSRKAMLSFSLRMSQVAAVGIIFFDNMELFMFVRVLYGIAYAITNVTLHTLALELCSPLLRPCRFFILHALSDGISYVLIPLVASFCVHWRYLLCFYSIGILFLPLVDWFVPASPLWFYTKSRKVAWTLLKSSKTPHVNNEVLSFYQNNKVNLSGELFWLLNDFKRTKQTFLWCYVMLIGISSSICSTNFIGKRIPVSHF
ncbi:PREDICTED: probable metabolite transport protein YDR387C [Nicrophorus vespilloides]|uniref:Probable metabolite transport protein YDR387C n=1 Tax=Nicrophorus vespilloides TaxID=110193 RepID=A0ABM1MTP8_NICVS|nr:PREDICTED: probable metabolite transport protein YDR387C [Nicrophorus vespilloides]